MCFIFIVLFFFFFFFQAEDGIRDWSVTGVQTCALPIWAQDSVLRIAQVRGTINVRSKTGPNRLGAAVRQGGIDSSPALDVLRAGRSSTVAEAGHRRGVSRPSAAPAARRPRPASGSMSRGSPLPGWWNWHSRGAQNAMPARACGFDSRPRYQLSYASPTLTGLPPGLYREASRGAVAQLGEHKAGSLGVRGSNPLSSTIFPAR